MRQNWMRRLSLGSTREVGVGKASGLGIVGSLAQSLMRTITNILIGRLAGPVALGVVSSAISLGNLLVLAWPATAGNAASKFIGRARGTGDSEALAAAANHIGKRSISATLAIAGLSIPLWVLIDEGSPISGVVVSLLVAGLGGAAYTRGVHYGVGQVSRSTVWEVATGAAGLAGTMFVLVAGVDDGIVVLMPIALSYLLYTLACWPRGSRGRPPKQLRREIDAFIAVGTLGTLAGAGFLHLSVLMVRTYGDAYDAGQYAAALALATPVALLGRALSMALYPRMARDYGSGRPGNAADTARRFTLILTLLLIPTLGTIAILREEIVALVWGREFDTASTILPILLLAVFLTSIRVPAVNFLSSGPQRGIVLVTIFSVLGLIAGVLIWIATLGVAPIGYAVATGYAGGAFLTSLLSVLFAARGDCRYWMAFAARAALGVGLIVLALAVEPTTLIGKMTAAAVFLTTWSIGNLGVARRLVGRSDTRSEG